MSRLCGASQRRRPRPQRVWPAGLRATRCHARLGQTVTTGHLRVGRATVAFGDALRWASAYLDAARNRNHPEPYAFPAYDQFDSEDNQPERLTDADLLAPVLLNVGISIRSFYALQALRPRLEKNLLDIGDLALVEASDLQLRSLVSPIYNVLDEPGIKPHGVEGTKLSKVVHRKRPNFLVLHDQWVRRCYLGTDAVPRQDERSWADYMVLLSMAIRDDLITQEDAWRSLQSASASAGMPAVTLPRLLDIVAWHAGQQLVE